MLPNKAGVEPLALPELGTALEPSGTTPVQYGDLLAREAALWRAVATAAAAMLE